MKKKYYFNSIFSSLMYLFIVLFLIGCIILCCFADEMHSGVIFSLISFSISAIIVLFWVGFSFSMRIQIDYEKEELYIIHPYFLKRLKFEDIVFIQIFDYNEVAFDFIITTKNSSKKLAYARYYKKRATAKRIEKVNELKNDLRNISNKNF